MTVLFLPMRTFSVITPPFIAVLIAVYCCLGMVCDGFAAESRTNWATEAYLKNRESVVFIQGDKVEERRRNSVDSERAFNGMGTGIIIDERGYIITNHHVVRDIREIQVTTYDQNPNIGTAAHRPYIAEVVATDTETDLAIIKVNPRTPLRPIVFGRSHDLMPGEVCMAIGNPYGYAFTLTDGRISAINREVGVPETPLVYRLAIQTNTGINPGNSGGPLINAKGEMIGINVAIRQGAAGIAFAMPVDQVVEVAAKLIGEVAHRQVAHGLTVSQIEPSNYDTVRRFFIRVDAVEANSPAAQAGIQRGDFLTNIGGYTLRNKLDFHRALLSLRPNEDVAFSVLRNNELLDIAVAIRSPRNGAVVVANRNVSSSPSPTPAAVAPRTAGSTMTNEERTAERNRLVWENLGIQYAQIPEQEYKRMYPQFVLVEDADFSGGGVVVRGVRSGSPAAQAGITTGDIIVGIDPRVTGLGPWEIASVNDIQFIGAQEWARLQTQTDILRADVIRDNIHYAAEIPMR